MPGAYLANNLISSSAVITVSSEDTAYPKSNIYDRQAARVFRCQSATTLNIEVDLVASAGANAVALINHNLASGATITIKAGGSSPPSTVVASPTWRLHDLWKSFATTVARYWRVEISVSNVDPIEIGQVVLGSAINFPRGRRIAEDYSPAVSRSNLAAETYAGVFWNYHLFERRRFNPSFRVADAAELDVLSDLDAAVYGNLFPFVYIPIITGADCYYVRKEESFEPVELDRIKGGDIAHDYTMTLIEESRGLEITA